MLPNYRKIGTNPNIHAISSHEAIYRAEVETATVRVEQTAPTGLAVDTASFSTMSKGRNTRQSRENALLDLMKMKTINFLD